MIKLKRSKEWNSSALFFLNTFWLTEIIYTELISTKYFIRWHNKLSRFFRNKLAILMHAKLKLLDITKPSQIKKKYFHNSSSKISIGSILGLSILKWALTSLHFWYSASISNHIYQILLDILYLLKKNFTFTWTTISENGFKKPAKLFRREISLFYSFYKSYAIHFSSKFRQIIS